MSHARGRVAHMGSTFLALLMLVTTHSAAQSVDYNKVNIETHGKRIAIDVVDTPIRDVLQALVDKRLLDVDSSLALDQRISLNTHAEPLPTLIRRLLRQHSYSLVYHTSANNTSSENALPTQPPYLRVFSNDGKSGPIRWQAHTNSASSDIDRAIADLASADPDVREEAVLTLSDTGDTDVAVHFISSLEDPAVGVREAARAALEDMETTDFTTFDRLTKQENDD